MFAVETALLHIDADRRIERPATLVCYCDGERDGFVQEFVNLNRLADVLREPRQLTRRVESRTDFFHVTKPSERAVDRKGGTRRGTCFCEHIDCRDGTHYRDCLGAAFDGHLAFERASVTASWNASLLSVAPET